MKKGMIWFFGVCSFGCFLITGLCLFDHYRTPQEDKGLMPFKSVLRDQGNHTFRGKFEAGYSGQHYIGINFPNKTTDPEVNKYLANWRSIGIKKEDRLPCPEVHWQVLCKNKVIEQGILLGETNGLFDVKSGRRYDIEIFIDPEYDKFLKQSPELEISFMGAGGITVANAIGQALNIPLSIGFGIAGFVFLIFTLVIYFSKWK